MSIQTFKRSALVGTALLVSAAGASAESFK